MTTKLTLSVDKEVIEKAKRYAQSHNRSLSQIVTHYLEALTEEEQGHSEIDSEILELADEIPIEELPSEEADAKYRYLKDKYLHG
jgi:hypothetical protein